MPPVPRLPRPQAAALALLALQAVPAAAAEVEVVALTPPVCSELPVSGHQVCTNVAEITVRIPAAAGGLRLVQCLLHSEEGQVLGVGEAFLRPPGGSLWVLLRPRYRFDDVTLLADTRCAYPDGQAPR